MKLFFTTTAAIAALGLGMVFLNTSEEADAALTPDQEKYCADVEKWRMQQLLDVPKWSRTSGSPDYKGTYQQWCVSSK
ncbi:hypothetical protein [Halomonas shantousis]